MLTTAKKILSCVYQLKLLEDKKEMKKIFDRVDHEKKFMDALLEKVKAAKEGQALPWHKPWKSSPESCISFNMATGNFYSGYNAIAFDSGGYLTLKQANENSLRIKESELKKYSIGVYSNRIETKDSYSLPDNEKKFYFMQKTFLVYHFDQLEEDSKQIALKKFKSLNSKYLNDKIKEQSELFKTNNELFKKYLDKLNCFKIGGHKACYKPWNDEINIPKINDFFNESEYFSTLSHECIHSTGYESRLNRDLSNSFGSEGYAFEELIAEIGASLLCAQLNIDYMGNTIDNSHRYLVSWLKKLDYDTKELYKALPLAKKAIKVILE